MRRIELFTQGSEGGFVAVVEIAPFPDRGMPDVVLWGERTFMIARGLTGSHGRQIYREAFAFVSLTPSPGIERHDETCPETCDVMHPPPPPPPVDRGAITTLHGMDPHGDEHRETRADGMQKDYVVLTAGERAKGFVRPVRRSYRHVGKPGHNSKLDGAASRGCGGVTTMGIALAETYARDPKFYGGTFCATCKEHFPVGAEGEFVWADTDERVGT